ncbi:hypothetical protein BDR07DRAFT_1478711 [Suillus spraguei]|nr:hypothetical protein BDR07DRAFT_1478711 [Suillus spraguei]
MSNFNPHEWHYPSDMHNQPSLSHPNPHSYPPSASFNNYLDSFGTGCANPSYPDSSSYNYFGAGHTNSFYTNSSSGAGSSNLLSGAGYTNSLSGAGCSNLLPGTGNTNSPGAGCSNSLSGAASPVPMQPPIALDSLSGATSPVPMQPPTAPDHLTGPIPHWLGDDADAMRALTYHPAADEIPGSNVIHTSGPARSSERCRQSRRMPPTPSLAPYSVPSHQMHAPTPTATAGPSSDAASLTDIVIQAEPLKKIIKGIIFSPDAITSSSEVQKCLVQQVIRKAVLSVPSLHGLNQWPSVSKDVSMIWRGVIVVRSTMMTIAQQHIMTGYDLLPPHNYDKSPEQFHID